MGAAQPVVDLQATESVRLILDFLRPYAWLVVGFIGILCVGWSVGRIRSKGR